MSRPCTFRCPVEGHSFASSIEEERGLTLTHRNEPLLKVDSGPGHVTAPDRSRQQPCAPQKSALDRNSKSNALAFRPAQFFRLSVRTINDPDGRGQNRSISF